MCVGSLILGGAGLLKGVPATSHWNTLQDLHHFGAQPIEQRFVRHGKIMTAAGVSAGIDMALQLVATEYGERGREVGATADRVRPSPASRQRFHCEGVARHHRSGATVAAQHVRVRAEIGAVR